MERVYNFSAGPSMLPEPVLRQAAAEMLNYKGSGQSVMEMSHRSPVYEEIIAQTEALVRSLMGVPQNYEVLFLQGGASLQFAMVPLNLMGITGQADYTDTGMFAKKAAEEAAKFGAVNTICSSKDRNYAYVPAFPGASAKASYVHITTNNTIFGTRWTSIPKTGAVPLVADASSNILSEPWNIEDFGLIYAGAQKNIGPAGVTLVIIRRDLIGKAPSSAPTMLRYDTYSENQSMYNTPPCYAIYIMKLVLEHVQALGGVKAMYEINKEKAGILYDFLDNSRLFKGAADREHRSLMNATFVLPTEDLNKAFVKEAEAKGLVNLKGHRSVGGMRASIYNAMPVLGVKTLVEVMKDFEKRNH